MHPAITEIADVRGISYAEAEEFCRAVYRHFVGRVPKYEALAQAVRATPCASPTEIAQTVTPKSVVALPKPVDPPAPPPQQAPPPRPKPQQPPTAHYALLDNDESEPMRTDTGSRLPKNPLRSLNRLDPEKAETCPHGIPFYRKCAICNPEEFAEMTGWD